MAVVATGDRVLVGRWATVTAERLVAEWWTDVLAKASLAAGDRLATATDAEVAQRRATFRPWQTDGQLAASWTVMDHMSALCRADGDADSVSLHVRRLLAAHRTPATADDCLLLCGRLWKLTRSERDNLGDCIRAMAQSVADVPGWSATANGIISGR